MMALTWSMSSGVMTGLMNLPRSSISALFL